MLTLNNVYKSVYRVPKCLRSAIATLTKFCGLGYSNIPLKLSMIYTTQTLLNDLLYLVRTAMHPMPVTVNNYICEEVDDRCSPCSICTHLDGGPKMLKTTYSQRKQKRYYKVLLVLVRQ